MPSRSAVHEQITDILVPVVGCDPADVVPEATLVGLGTDSLTIVEVGEELGRRFGLHLADETIDAMVTVKDAVDAVVRHDGPRQPPPSEKAITVPPVETERHRGRAVSFLAWFAVIGAVIGVVLGVGGAALVSATGIDAVDLPPVSAPTTPAPTETTTPEPTDEPTQTTGEPEPTITASATRVAPGARFRLEGVFPGSDTGEKLQVEVRDEGAGWDDFPITPVTRDGGTFRTEIYTSRTGTREFRVTNTETGVSSPSVTIEIG